MIGRMYSSVVGQYRLSLQTLTTDGFQVTSERERYAYRLNALTSLSNPGSGSTSGTSWPTSANIRLMVWVASVRICSSSSQLTIRLDATLRLVTAAMLLPFLSPKALPVSSGEAKGSNEAFVQSASMCSNVALMWSDWKFSTWSISAFRYASL